MKISSIIPAYNASRFLERSVKSLIDTGYPELEIVIVDDGSEDNTFEVARELSNRYPDKVMVYQHPRRANLGVSASRNLGIRKSTGELICFLDANADVLYFKGRGNQPSLKVIVNDGFELKDVITDLNGNDPSIELTGKGKFPKD